MEKYKIPLMQEKIELSEDTVETIRTSAKIGSFEFRGGKHKKTKRKNNPQKNNPRKNNPRKNNTQKNNTRKNNPRKK